MNWELQIGEGARKNLARFPKKDRERIIATLRGFALNPYFGDIEKIEGEENVWRRRIGNYRIMYELNVAHRIIFVRDIRRRTSNTY